MKIPSYMLDRHGRLKPASYMDIAQEMAVNGSEDMRATDRELLACGKAWIIARMHIRFVEMPRRWDVVTARTWHKGLDGIYFLRDCCLEDGKGRTLIASTSSWIVMDVAERRAVRPSSVPPCVSTEPQCPGDAVEEPCPKIQKDKSWSFVKIGEHRVSYSDVDYNGHANNAKYISWIMDNMPEDLVYGKCLRELYLNFIHEALPGDDVGLFCHQDGDAFIVEGRSGDKSVFLAELVF